MTVFETWKPEETYELGKKMGEEAVPGQVICLNGDLGVGKTVFTQGFAAGLGIEGPVNSPSLYHCPAVWGRTAAPVSFWMFTASAISVRWMKSAMRTAFSGTACA